MQGFGKVTPLAEGLGKHGGDAERRGCAGEGERSSKAAWGGAAYRSSTCSGPRGDDIELRRIGAGEREPWAFTGAVA